MWKYLMSFSFPHNNNRTLSSRTTLGMVPITPIIIIRFDMALSVYHPCSKSCKTTERQYFILYVRNREPETKGFRDLPGQQHADICAIPRSLFNWSYEKNPTVRPIGKKMHDREMKKFILLCRSPWITLPYLNPISLGLILHISW